MRPRIAALLAFVMACSTASNSQQQPDIQLIQLSNVAEAARHMTGGFSVQYRLVVSNTTTAPLTIKRVDLQSVGMGAYRLPLTSRPFDVVIAAGEEKAVELWGAAVIDDATIVGANGPVTIRAIVQFDGSGRLFQSVVMQQVRPSS